MVAVIGKTEGNGGVNDFTRILADQAFRAVLKKHGNALRSRDRQHSDGLVGRLRRRDHAARDRVRAHARDRPAGKSRLVIGTAISAEILPEDIGRPAMVEKVAEGVRAAMRDAGITDPRDVHYVQTKTPLLTVNSVLDAHARPGGRLRGAQFDGHVERHHGLGIAVGLGEITMPKAEEICHDLDLYSSVASCSSGVELDAGADRASWQQGRRRRPLSHRPFA